MDEEEYYKAATPESYGKEDHPVLDRSRQQFVPPSSSGARRRSVGAEPTEPRGVPLRVATNGQQHRNITDPAARSSRKASVASQSDSRKQLADDRSPLQRLELTLDSITKEEKRARVEAAEQAAREREPQDEAMAQGTTHCKSNNGPGREPDRDLVVGALLEPGYPGLGGKPCVPRSMVLPLLLPLVLETGWTMVMSPLQSRRG